jgi:hypothetical protein
MKKLLILGAGTAGAMMANRLLERSGLGDELNFVATDRHTLQSKQHPPSTLTTKVT